MAINNSDYSYVFILFIGMVCLNYNSRVTISVIVMKIITVYLKYLYMY